MGAETVYRGKYGSIEEGGWEMRKMYLAQKDPSNMENAIIEIGVVRESAHSVWYTSSGDKKHQERRQRRDNMWEKVFDNKSEAVQFVFDNLTNKIQRAKKEWMDRNNDMLDFERLYHEK